MRHPHGYLALGLVLGLVSLAAAGCGGGSGSPGVANLGTDAGTTSTSSSAPSGSGSAPSSGSSGNHVQMMLSGGQNALKFSQCMRAHGVSNFPDPNGQGQIQVGPSSGIDPGSSTFQSAMQACQHLVGHGTATPAQQAQARRQALAFSACMRKHGVPDFPDPNFRNGGISIHLDANGPSDLNPSSPTFQAAQQACQGHLPFKNLQKTGSFGSGGAK
jgi:hypothetical protein